MYGKPIPKGPAGSDYFISEEMNKSNLHIPSKDLNDNLPQWPLSELGQTDKRWVTDEPSTTGFYTKNIVQTLEYMFANEIFFFTNYCQVFACLIRETAF